MSKIESFDSVISLFQNLEGNFYIPEYQRPYEWKEDECQKLWEDLCDFIESDKSGKYFLGSIVTYISRKKKAIIDGQQRITTLMLLMRAFYEKLDSKTSNAMRADIAKCIYNIDKNRDTDPSKPKLIISEAVTETDKEEFYYIIANGLEGKDPEKESGMKSRYAENYRFFKKNIQGFQSKISSKNPAHNMINRIMDSCVLLSIETTNMDTALKIFSTLNDRGLQLSDADIFKADIYKYFHNKDKKKQFIDDWKMLEERTEKIFEPKSGTPMTELFMHYMHCVRAEKGEKNSTTMALRKFYKINKLLDSETLALKVFEDIKVLSEFWENIAMQNNEVFSEDVLKRLFVLNYMPNSMWTYILSVYCMKNKKHKNSKAFVSFLDKITALILIYALLEKSVSDLRRPIYSAMVSVMKGEEMNFNEILEISELTEDEILSMFESNFDNRRPATKSFLAWWAFQNSRQQLIVDTNFEIEHIYAKNNEYNDKIEWLGNKSLLEKSINIRASDLKFSEKMKRYKGIKKNGKQGDPTKIVELLELEKRYDDFRENEIKDRNNEIVRGFVSFLKKNGFLRNSKQKAVIKKKEAASPKVTKCQKNTKTKGTKK